MKKPVAILVLVLSLPLIRQTASAGTVPAGSVIVAVWSNPITAGAYTGLDGNPVPTDNSSTAVVSIVNSTSPALGGTPPTQLTGSKIQWGADPGFNPDFSNLIFFGKPVTGDPTQTFDLGTITYLNGTSNLNSIIFGATLNLYATNDGNISSSNAFGMASVNIVTTANLGGFDDPIYSPHDADYIGISGIATQTFNVYEGHAATAELYGHFVGDPMIVLDFITLDPGQDANGFIGSGQAAVAPEPASHALFASGIAALILFRRRRQRIS